MKIQKIATVIAITTGLSMMSLSTAQADEREQRYYDHDEQRHVIQEHRRANKALRHQIRDNRRENKAIRHQAREHRYKHKNGIPHRHVAGVAVPHKSWRKQHQRWDYARFDVRPHQSRLQLQFSRIEPHRSRYFH